MDNVGRGVGYTIYMCRIVTKNVHGASEVGSIRPIFPTLLPYAGKTNGSKCKESGVALKLGLRKPPDISVDEYYPTFLNMAKNFMEGIYML